MPSNITEKITIDENENTIEINKLVKKFKNFVAVDSVDLQINKGELFGLLGPNGAGKTTTLNILATLLPPTSGDAKINGFNLKEQNKIRHSIGFVFQDSTLDDELTARENLDIHGRLYHLPKNLRKQRIDEVLDLVELKDKENRQVKTFSGGMKRRLEIARGMMHHPKILFLDEPTLGLDPQTRRNVWNHIERLNKEENLTIILTTHYLEEADYLCNRIAIIDHGKIVAIDSPDNLKKTIRSDTLVLKTNQIKDLVELLQANEISEFTVFENSVNLATDKGERIIPDLLNLASKNQVSINSVELKKSTLEDVFIHFTGHQIREDQASSADVLRNALKATGRF
ncbi:MAG: ATP-binding cassette domain-containing protein [Nitrosarchaeum sp.]|nr:ATP-binding cassette domain-containing protein [Nitrosarchaeum sp.]MCA9820650.1 ATP-binding cassette domain-containing protein [Nitrosarchaeum sp.]